MYKKHIRTYISILSTNKKWQWNWDESSKLICIIILTCKYQTFKFDYFTRENVWWLQSFFQPFSLKLVLKQALYIVNNIIKGDIYTEVWKIDIFFTYSVISLMTRILSFCIWSKILFKNDGENVNTMIASYFGGHFA